MIVFMDVNIIGAILISQSDRARLVAILGLVGQGEVSYYVITTCAVWREFAGLTEKSIQQSFRSKLQILLSLHCEKIY